MEVNKSMKALIDDKFFDEVTPDLFKEIWYYDNSIEKNPSKLKDCKAGFHLEKIKVNYIPEFLDLLNVLMHFEAITIDGKYRYLMVINGCADDDEPIIVEDPNNDSFNLYNTMVLRNGKWVLCEEYIEIEDGSPVIEDLSKYHDKDVIKLVSVNNEEIDKIEELDSSSNTFLLIKINEIDYLIDSVESVYEEYIDAEERASILQKIFEQ